jgi:hypothetical protein
MRHTVVYCLKPFAWLQYYCMSLDDGRMNETCCGNNIGGGEKELLRWWTIIALLIIHTQQEAWPRYHNSWLHIQLTSSDVPEIQLMYLDRSVHYVIDKESPTIRLLIAQSTAAPETNNSLNYPRPQQLPNPSSIKVWRYLWTSWASSNRYPLIALYEARDHLLH